MSWILFNASENQGRSKGEVCVLGHVEGLFIKSMFFIYLWTFSAHFHSPTRSHSFSATACPRSSPKENPGYAIARNKISIVISLGITSFIQGDIYFRKTENSSEN